MTRVMATATRKAMATGGNTMGNSYRYLSSSAVAVAVAAAAAAVGKEDKGGDGLFLYGVLVKKNWFVNFLN